MTYDLTILGERQAGKTHLLTAMAVEEASNGGTVWYQSASPHLEHNNFLNCLDRAEAVCPDKIKRPYRSNGKQRIVFKNGGEILFYPQRISSDIAGDARRLVSEKRFDLHILDDVSAERLANAKRSVRAVLS